jgi:2-polyprenyl-3-methyl-5-hydroxy-6-metoxy-1,4-benzoquinol methylase
VKTGNTAIRRNKPSRPLKLFLEELEWVWLLVHDEYTHKKDWFDLGCGRGDDVEYLQKYLRPDSTGATVQGYDPNHAPDINPWDLYSGSKDIVTCFYVLNVLQDPRERMKVLADARHLVKHDGIVAVAARSKDSVRRAVTANTYQRGFDAGELAQLLVDAGFEITVSLTDNRDYCMVVGIEAPYLGEMVL